MAGISPKSVGVYAKYSVSAVQHAATSKRRTRFVLFGLGRNGSTLLSELLNSHPSIQCDGEILAEKVASPRLLVAAHAMAAPQPAYGFKLLSVHMSVIQEIDPQKFVDWLDRRGYQIVYLTRRNPLRNALSIMKARQQVFHSRGDTAAQPATVHIDVTELGTWLDLIAKQTAIDNQLMTRYPDVLSFVYEDDLINAEKQATTVNRICETLGLAPSPVSSDLVRTTSDNLRDWIANYDEVAGFVATSPYAKYLTD